MTCKFKIYDPENIGTMVTWLPALICFILLQVVAAPYKDHLCIAVAKELQKAFGGWVPPFPV
jgi:hypothetical protein